MQSLRHACSFSHALAAHRTAALRGATQNATVVPGNYSSKRAHALGQGLMSLLLIAVICRKVQFCKQSEQHPAPDL